MFLSESTGIEGVAVLRAPGANDERGTFRKLLHADAFAASGLRGDYAECYVSTSRAGTIRGMHFQMPPHDHAKLVWCLGGHATDVVLDLRRGSATYGRSASFELAGEAPVGVYMPAGIAHGFAARSDGVVLLYMVTSVYAPVADAGIRWDSFGFDWGIDAPVMSDRDRNLPRFGDFRSPF